MYGTHLLCAAAAVALSARRGQDFLELLLLLLLPRGARRRRNREPPDGIQEVLYRRQGIEHELDESSAEIELDKNIRSGIVILAEIFFFL